MFYVTFVFTAVCVAAIWRNNIETHFRLLDKSLATALEHRKTQICAAYHTSLATFCRKQIWRPCNCRGGWSSVCRDWLVVDVVAGTSVIPPLLIVHVNFTQFARIPANRAWRRLQLSFLPIAAAAWPTTVSPCDLLSVENFSLRHAHVTH